MAELTKEMLEKWKEQGKDPNARIYISPQEWVALCTAALLGLEIISVERHRDHHSDEP